MQVDAHVSAQNLESIKVHQPGIEAAWSTTAQLHEATELVIQEAWQESLLPRGEEGSDGEEEGSDGTEDHGLPLDNSTIHWKPPDDGIVLLELFGGIGTGLAAVLQAGIKVQRYVYVDTDEAARQVAKHHSRGLRVRFLELLTTTAILSAFSSLTGDISLISEKDLHWLGHMDLVIVGWQECQNGRFWMKMSVRTSSGHPPASAFIRGRGKNRVRTVKITFARTHKCVRVGAGPRDHLPSPLPPSPPPSRSFPLLSARPRKKKF
jgi:hypothetical protein